MGIFPMRLAFNGPKNCLNAFPYDDYSKRLRKMRLAAYSSKNYFCNCSVTRELDFGTAAKKIWKIFTAAALMAIKENEDLSREERYVCKEKKVTFQQISLPLQDKVWPRHRIRS